MTALEHSQTHLTASVKGSIARTAEALEAQFGREISSNCTLLPIRELQALISACPDEVNASPEAATALARGLFGLYRKADFQEPEVFVAGVAAVFAEFPEWCGRRVASPVKGIAARLKFPPSIAEITDALNAEKYRRDGILWRARQQLAEHERRAAESARRLTEYQRRAMLERLAPVIASIGGDLSETKIKENA